MIQFKNLTLARGARKLIEDANMQIHAGMRVGLVDEMLVYLAPRVLGGGAGMVGVTAENLPSPYRFCFADAEAIGGDLRVRLRRLQIPD